MSLRVIKVFGGRKYLYSIIINIYLYYTMALNDICFFLMTLNDTIELLKAILKGCDIVCIALIISLVVVD